ncbi:hypothetical protein ABIA16_003846 [Sinorhizobium fredii]
MPADTFITVQARFALYVIIVVGAALLVAGTAYQAYALDRQMAVQARV